MSVPECVIFVGLPGAGKSSFYRERFATTHRHISKDLWPNRTGREVRQEKVIDQSLSTGASIVVDNTNPAVADRAAIINAARRYHASIIGYFFDVTTRVAVARNAERSGRARVANVAIFTTAKRLEPPRYAEGFKQLFRVEIAKDRSLRVTEIAR